MFDRLLGIKSPPPSLSPSLEDTIELGNALKIMDVDVNTPRSFELLLPEGDTTLDFYVFGCGGDDKHNNQSVVAAHMEQIAMSSRRPHFIILLGDNFYDNGVNSTRDPLFQKNFYGPYHNPKLKTICGVPYFVIMGNHCYDLSNGYTQVFMDQVTGYLAGQLKPQKLMAQVAHTFCDVNGEPDKVFKDLYASDRLELAKLHAPNMPKWNMPSRFYHLHCGQVELFFLDSNFYVKEFLKADRATDPNNQATWLEMMAKKNPGTSKFIFLHHPLKTLGKRAFPKSFDWHHYLSLNEMKDLREQYNITGGYNEMLRAVMLEKQGLKFDGIFAAHDHVMGYYLDRDADPQNPFCQAIIGSGGGTLQDRRVFESKAHVPFFANEFGFVNVQIDTVNPDRQFLLDFHYSSASPKQVRFSNRDVQSIQQSFPIEDEDKIRKLKAVVQAAYEKYLEVNFLARGKEKSDDATHEKKEEKAIEKAAEKAPASGWKGWAQSFTATLGALGEATGLTHGYAGAGRADSLRNFFNTYQIPSFQACVNFLRESFGERYSSPDDKSLITLVNNEFKARHGITYAQFIENPSLINGIPAERSLKSDLSVNHTEPQSLPNGICVMADADEEDSQVAQIFSESPNISPNLQPYSQSRSPSLFSAPVTPRSQAITAQLQVFQLVDEESDAESSQTPSPTTPRP